MKRKSELICACPHNPKVGGSNPSTAIETFSQSLFAPWFRSHHRKIPLLRKSKPSTPATHKRIPIPGCEAGLCSGLLRSRDVGAYALTMLWTVDLESWSWAAMARTLRPSLWSLRLPVHNHLRPAELLALLPCPRNTSSPIFSMCNFS